MLELYDDATTALGNASARSGLCREVQPDAKVREAAEQCEQQLEAYNVRLAQDCALHDVLSKVDTAKLDAAAGFWLFKTLREFRRLGVDRSEATRTQVRAERRAGAHWPDLFPKHPRRRAHRAARAQGLGGSPRGLAREPPAGRRRHHLGDDQHP